MVDSVMVYQPKVIVVGGSITKANNPGLMAKKIKKRIEELSR
jgi:3-keto-L-gulonate-6-phosphate decarboxylase